MKKFYRRKFLLNKNVLFSPFAKSLLFFPMPKVVAPKSRGHLLSFLVISAGS